MNNATTSRIERSSRHAMGKSTPEVLWTIFHGDAEVWSFDRKRDAKVAEQLIADGSIEPTGDVESRMNNWLNENWHEAVAKGLVK
jgi:hypothetical protein